MNQQSNVCFMDGIIAADNLDDNLPEMRRNALTQIIKQFTATHVFERCGHSSSRRGARRGRSNEPGMPMQLQQEHDANYPKEILISYTEIEVTGISNIGPGTHTISGRDSSGHSDFENLVELANLVSFGGKIYAKNSNGGPIETIQYQRPQKYNSNNKDICNAIATLATLILNPIYKI